MSALVFAFAASPLRAASKVKDIKVEGNVATLLIDGDSAPSVRKLEGPPRLIVDLPDTLLAHASMKASGDGAPIVEWRAGQFQLEPHAITRLVIVLKEKSSYKLVAVSGGHQLIIGESKPAGLASVTPTATTVELKLDAPVKFDSKFAADPVRLVVELGAKLKDGAASSGPGMGRVKRWSVASTATGSRVELELEKKLSYRVVPGKDGLTVDLDPFARR